MAFSCAPLANARQSPLFTGKVANVPMACSTAADAMFVLNTAALCIGSLGYLFPPTSLLNVEGHRARMKQISILLFSLVAPPPLC
jgi:hypothetical protein